MNDFERALTIVAVTKIRYQEPVSIRYAQALTQQLEPILPGSAPGRTRSSTVCLGAIEGPTLC